MRDQKGNKARLLHIKEAISEIEDYTRNFDFEDFFHASARYASIKQLEIIGEAANHISNEFMIKYPEIEWRIDQGRRSISRRSRGMLI